MLKAINITRQIGILMVCIIMFFSTWKIIAGLVGAEAEREAFIALISGPYAFNFWVFEVFAGMLLPLVLYVMSRGTNLKMLVIGSISMIFGIFFMRYDLVIVGQIVPAHFELGVNEYAALLSYTPSAHEILIVLGGIGLVGVLFLLGEKIFAAHEVKEDSHALKSHAVFDIAEQSE